MKPALLLVDLQEDFLKAPGFQPSADALIARAAELLAGCRQGRVPICHIWTTLHRSDDRRLSHWRQRDRWLCVAGTDGQRTPSPLEPREGEFVIHKTGYNAFANPELDAALKGGQCDTVVVAGVHIHACVRAIATECLERQLQVLVAEDAVGSNDPFHAAATRRWLTERCVRFEPVSLLLARLQGTERPPLIHYSPRETCTALFEVPVAGAEEIATATARARNAWEAWQNVALNARCSLLEQIAARLDAAVTALARQMAIEIGKPVGHGKEEVRRAAANIRDVIRRAAARPVSERSAAGLVRHQPLGVVALISPWNNPVAIPMGKVAPALVYGNAVVWKSAPAATGISRVLLQFLRDAGMPSETVQLLTGDHTTAQQLAGQDAVDAVTLTGSAPAGAALLEICSRRAVPLQAELSGNNAAIVWDDARVPEAAAQIAWGAFGFAGQRCTANRRVIVSEQRMEEFLSALIAAAGQLTWGDPLDPATEIGPVIHVAKRDEQVALIRAAQSAGAIRRLEWTQASRASESWVGQGAYAQPAIVCCDLPEHRLVQEETMSPLLVVQRAGDFEHALALSDGVRHGLVAALFSHSPDLQRRFLSTARAGILKLNTSTAGVDVSLPFGGWKASGLGPPEHGEGDAQFFTRLQAVYGAEGNVISP